jgi:AsmA protein
MRGLKWIALGLAAVALVLVAVAAYVVATFDPEAYKPRLVEAVKRETGRTLAIDGKISVTFFPRIGAAVGKVTLSEPGSPAVFARVEDARVAVALWPLLSGQVIVDRVALKGLAANLVRDRSGRTNFDDLVRRRGAARPGAPPGPAGGGPALAVDVRGIDVEDADLRWRDERDGTDVRLSGVSLRTGRLASGVPGKLVLGTRVESARPKASLQLDLETGYRIDFAGQAVALSSLDAKVKGDAQGMAGIDARARAAAVELDLGRGQVGISALELTARTKDGLEARATVPKLLAAPDRAESQAIAADVALAAPARSVRAKIAVAPFAGKSGQVQVSRLDVEFAVKQADLSVEGALATPATLDLDRRQARLHALAGTLRLGGGRIPDTTAAVSGSARADWGAEDAAADLAVKLDDSSIGAKVGVRRWSSPAIALDVTADRLDLDRYLTRSGPAAPRSGGPPAGKAPAGGGPAPAEEAWDLSPLRALDVTGTVKVGALKVSNVRAEQVALAVKAAGGRLDVDPISARLYQGALAGSAAVDARSNAFALRQRLTDVSVGPLLRDLADKDLLEGRGTIAVDVTSAGTTVTALKKALAGSARAAVRDGSLKGVDIVRLIGVAQTLLGARRTLEQEAQGGARTDFSEMTATFAIRNGVARNEDLAVRSPLVGITGRGDIDIGRGSLDYTASAALTATGAGLGGRDLLRLVGVAVPVRATGALAAPTYTVDVGAMATGLAKGALSRELERRLGGDRPQGTQGSDPVGDVLRGLLGKPKARPRRRAAPPPRPGSRTAYRG